MARLRRELAEKKAESEKEEVWSDLKRSQQLAKEIAAIESKTDTFDKAEKAINDTEEILALLEEENDESLDAELDAELDTAAKDIEEST